MRPSVLAILGIALAYAYACGAGPVAAADPPQREKRPQRKLSDDTLALVRATNAFAWHLWDKLPDDGSNLLCSPLSISSALAMMYAGAEGETSNQIASVLQIGEFGPRVHSVFGTFLRETDDAIRPASDPPSGNPPSSDLLEVSNALWGQAGLKFLPEFRAILEREYDADLSGIEFRDVDRARRTINDWVDGKTRGKINELIPPGGLDPKTPLLLTDVIYFKGQWATPFPKEATRTEDFHACSGKDVRAPFMHLERRFHYLEDDLGQVLELPYSSDLVLDIFLPKATEPPTEARFRLTSEVLKSRLSKLQLRRVDASLPRFRFTRSIELRAPLCELGMPIAFTPEADFSGMVTGGQGLALSAMIHKACVEVNEEGTVAAAVTAPTFTATSINAAGPAHFRADRPFLFLIRDRRTTAILFLGKVVEP